MIQKPFPVFGYVIVRNELTAGEVFTDQTIKENKYIVDEKFKTVWLQTKGHIHDVEDNTGATQDRYAGDSTLIKPEPIGHWTMQIVEDAVVFCLSPVVNENKYPQAPDVIHVAIAAGQTREFAKDSKLFLASGTLTVEGKTFDGPKQIRFASSAKTVTAVTNCYGLLFP